MEAKVNRANWEDNLPRLMRAYFEGSTTDGLYGVRNLPFFHKRPLSGGPWVRLNETSPDYRWLAQACIQYLYAFAYSVGRIASEDVLRSESFWLNSVAMRMDPAFPTLFLCVGWLGDPLSPRVAFDFTPNFPEDLKKRAERLLNAHVVAPSAGRQRLLE